jgi:hypothetical protein
MQLNVRPGVPASNSATIRDLGAFRFAPLVDSRIDLIAELDIILLRPGPPGGIITQGGDIDNRLKTLLDSLKVPDQLSALPQNASPEEDESPFFCLLEDDKLITNINVKTAQLFEPVDHPSEVVLLIRVQTKATKMTYGNMGLG